MRHKNHVVITNESLLVYCAMAKYYHVRVESLLNALLSLKRKRIKFNVSSKIKPIHTN